VGRCVGGIFQTWFAGQCGGREVVRTLGSVAALLVGIAVSPMQCRAAKEWSGALALTSDYLVRGISRTSNNPALQVAVNYSNPAGFLAGASASNTQYDPSRPADVELSAFIGYAWNLNDDWRGKILGSHYAYPWNPTDAHYSYDEIDLDIAYQGWLHFDLNYSPNTPRRIPPPYASRTRVDEKSAEVNVQRPIVGKLSATAGIGYSFVGGPESGGYTYWSLGFAYDWRLLTLAVSYVNTTDEAKALFYNAAANGRWTGTLMVRF
jgi:uncharacterized protein (TIGR02001 family)